MGLDAESFADGTPLVFLFSSVNRTRMLSVFVDERSRDLSVSEIAEQAGIARSTVYDHLDDFVEIGIVENTRKTGVSERYQLNMENDIAELLYKLDGVTLQALLEHDQ
ncbi:ArsR family transcriptional regulator [Halogeometricum borinquense]|uniref:ArsR family transcriptional regulator n=1 Tax=Halogeometricum borinquense TaxID=60847 RepID=A0A482TH22_9EURY|nr:winged helix-turn-helix domain-containing protein [Halogeometricum borinquense]RYJ19442.1 ArsR family transcriptional regulator [Halogeometricum borinquense]